MAERAQITSVEAIDAFRAQLILFLSKARPTLEEISADVVRTRMWLQSDQRRTWTGELKQRNKKLERAKGELLGSRLSSLEEVSAAQQMAVRKAQEAVRVAESKLALLKHWDRELDNRSEPMVKQINQLHDFLSTEMPRAVAYLTEVVKVLEAYAGVPRPGLSSSSPSPTEPPANPEGGKPEGAQP